MKLRLLTFNGITPNDPVAAHLTALSPDLIVGICKKAGPRASARIACTSTTLRGAVQAPHLWSAFYRRHIGPRDASMVPRAGWQQSFANEAGELQREQCLSKALAPLADRFEKHANVRRLVTVKPGWQGAGVTAMAALAKSLHRELVVTDGTSSDFIQQVTAAKPQDSFLVIKNATGAAFQTFLQVTEYLDYPFFMRDMHVVCLTEGPADDTILSAFPERARCDFSSLEGADLEVVD